MTTCLVPTCLPVENDMGCAIGLGQNACLLCSKALGSISCVGAQNHLYPSLEIQHICGLRVCGKTEASGSFAVGLSLRITWVKEIMSLNEKKKSMRLP